MSIGRRFVKNFFSLSGSDALARILGSVLTIYIARVLGANVFGQLSFAIAFTSYFTLFSDFGLTTLGIREIAKDKEKTAVYGTNILFLQLVISFILICLLGILLIFLPLTPRVKLITFLFGLGIIPGALNMGYIFQAHETMEYMALAKICSQIAYVIFGFVLIYLFKDILVLPIISFIAALIAAIIIFYLLRKKISFAWSKIEWQQIKKLAHLAWPFLVAALAVQIYYNIDSIMLQFMKGSEAVGLYNAPYKIILLIISLGNFIAGAIFPLLSSSFKHNKELFVKIIKTWARLNGILIFPVVVGGLILAEQILRLLYGVHFLAATLAFRLLILLPLTIFLSSVLVNPLLAMGEEKKNTLAVCLGALVNLVANFLLIPRFGLNGAALATLLAEITVFAYLAICFYKILRINVYYSYFIKPFSAALFMGFCLLGIKDRLPTLISIALGAIIYLTVLIVIKGFTKGDLDLLFKS